MSQGLTVKERERLEATIKEEVDSQVEFYKKWRAEQKQEVYKSVKATSEKADKSALEAFKKAMAGLKALGYEFRTSYRDDDVTAVKEIGNAKELTDFDRETDNTAETLKAIKRRTLMKLYTATGDNDILNEMITEITKVIGEPARKTCPRPNALIPVRGDMPSVVGLLELCGRYKDGLRPS